MNTSSSMTVSYRGRFAPSPTGPLHFGSLVGALVSYLDARHCGGQWLVRMEDIDPPREVPGAADTILGQLEQHGLFWDGEVLYQSSRTEAYLEALHNLRERGLVYPCACSRQQLQLSGGLHGQPCHGSSDALSDEHALRVHVGNHQVVFADLFRGQQQQQLGTEVGDFVLRRKDGLFAYQLAVVVDDAFQGFSHVIRGSDLLDSTPRQIYLQQLLGFGTPVYGHHSVVLNTEGQKLSKQNLSPAVENSTADANLLAAMQWLRMDVPVGLHGAPCSELLQWGIDNWQPKNLLKMPDSPEA